MRVTGRTPVGVIVAKQPRAAGLFDRHGIDYYCEGARQLEAACRLSNVEMALILSALDGLASESSCDRDWTTARLSDLIAHVVDVHHAYLWTALPALADRAEELPEVRFDGFKAGVEDHLREEERIVFPAIARREHAAASRRPAGPASPVLSGRLKALEAEHRNTLAALAALTGQVRAARACVACAEAVLDDLGRLERDLHRHLHLENNILFPRALALEAAYG